MNCKLCTAFLSDWLELPLTHGDIFYGLRNEKAFARIRQQIVHELASLFQESNMDLLHMNYISKKHLYEYYPFESIITLGFIENNIIYSGIRKIKSIDQTPYAENISAIRALLEDEYVFHTNELLEQWLGYIVGVVWKLLPEIHEEHTRRKEISNGGPAFGLRSYSLQTASNIKQFPLTIDEKEYDELYN